MVSTSLVCREIQAHDDDFMESTFSFVSNRKSLAKKSLIVTNLPNGQRSQKRGFGVLAVSICGTREQNSNVTKGPL